MGTRYYALNHDRQEAFAVGTMPFQDYGEHTDYKLVAERPQTLDEMRAYLVSEEFLPTRIEDMTARLHLFGIQDVLDTCADEIEDVYGEYTLVDSVYQNDDVVGKKLNYWM